MIYLKNIIVAIATMLIYVSSCYFYIVKNPQI